MTFSYVQLTAVYTLIDIHRWCRVWVPREKWFICMSRRVCVCVSYSVTAQSAWFERMAGPLLCQQQNGYSVAIAIVRRELSPELPEELTSHNLYETPSISPPHPSVSLSFIFMLSWSLYQPLSVVHDLYCIIICSLFISITLDSPCVYFTFFLTIWSIYTIRCIVIYCTTRQ